MTVQVNKHQVSDKQLVMRVRAGDISAYEIIVERYRAVLIARAHSRLASFADAEDVAQEAFIQAFFNLHKLRDPQVLVSWLRRIADRLALMHLRERREHPTNPEDLERIIEHRNHAQSTSMPEIECLLELLPATMREAIFLTIFAGYTCGETASIMGVSEGTVKSRLNRARKKLKEAMGMTERDIASSQPTSEFTQQTIERLKREARQRLAVGDTAGACRKAREILEEQVKSLFGDPKKSGVAKTMLTAFDCGVLRPDEEEIMMLGLPRTEQRRKECEANAAQYGYRLEDLDWEVTEVNMLSCTLGRPTGTGKDIWGVPVSHMSLDIIDMRSLCQRLRASPLVVYTWVKNGCPILRCWPFVRFDIERLKVWLREHGISEWPMEDDYHLERPIRVIFREVYEGRLATEQAETILREFGFGVWEAPLQVKGGW